MSSRRLWETGWKRVRPLILMAVVLLAACTRQADGPFQPVTVDGGSPVAVAASPTTEPLIDAPTIEITAGTDAGSGDVLPTETVETTLPEATPVEALLLTEEISPTTEAVPGEDTATPGEVVIFTVEPTLTEPPLVFDEPTSTPEESTSDGSEPTPQFITPGMPSDLMQVDTPTPVSGSGLDATPTTLPEAAGTITGDDATTPAEVDEDCIYVVQRGDSLFRIAINFDTTVAALRQVNEAVQNTDVIRPGDELFIPGCNITPTPTITRTPLPPGLTHTVKAGESLYTISLQYGVTIDALVAANDLANPNQLFVGQVLLIPEE